MKLHALKGYIQNIFLIEYEKGLMLLDGCSRADVKRVCNFITKDLKRPVTDLQLIVVTHMHPDHAGGAHKLRELTGCKIASHPKAPDWYRGVVGKLAHLTDVALTYWVADRIGRKKKHIWYSSRLRPDIVLNDNQVIPGFEDWQVLHTPGHTDHDISLWHVQSNQVYIADLIVSVKGNLRPPYPVCHPNQYKQSLERVGKMPNPLVYFAHVPPQKISAEDIAKVLLLAPEKPKNHWLSAKARIRHAFGLSVL